MERPLAPQHLRNLRGCADITEIEVVQVQRRLVLLLRLVPDLWIVIIQQPGTLRYSHVRTNTPRHYR